MTTHTILFLVIFKMLQQQIRLENINISISILKVHFTESLDSGVSERVIKRIWMHVFSKERSKSAQREYLGRMIITGTRIPIES